MVLGFLAVESVRNVATFIGERDRYGRYEWNAFVCGPEQHVVAHVRCANRFRVELREFF